jgi:hypothetical protein
MALAFEALARNLGSARNPLIQLMGDAMAEAQGQRPSPGLVFCLVLWHPALMPGGLAALALPNLKLVAVHGRQFAEAVTALLLLKFVPDAFPFLEGETPRARLSLSLSLTHTNT